MSVMRPCPVEPARPSLSDTWRPTIHRRLPATSPSSCSRHRGTPMVSCLGNRFGKGAVLEVAAIDHGSCPSPFQSIHSLAEPRHLLEQAPEVFGVARLGFSESLLVGLRD